MASFKRIHELGPGTVAEIDKRLLDGETPISVAHWLHDEKKVLKDLKVESVRKGLERYKGDDLRERVVQQLVDSTKNVPGPVLRKKIIAIDELQEVAAIQRGRLGRLLSKESTLPEGINIKEAQHEVRLYKEVLVELGKLQLETGVMRRAPRSVTGSTFDPETGEMRKFTWTEEQDALYKTIEGDVEAEVDAELGDQVQDAAADEAT